MSDSGCSLSADRIVCLIVEEFVSEVTIEALEDPVPPDDPDRPKGRGPPGRHTLSKIRRIFKNKE